MSQILSVQHITITIIYPFVKVASPQTPSCRAVVRSVVRGVGVEVSWEKLGEKIKKKEEIKEGTFRAGKGGAKNVKLAKQMGEFKEFIEEINEWKCEWKN